MRLDKFVCKSTELTKTEARDRIQSGVVRVNSASITDETTQVHESNDISMSGDLLSLRPFRYILMNKPAGTICSNTDEFYPSLFNFLDVEKPEELHIAGRLDADTTGLVLITDDGRWSFNITSPNMLCKKTYRVGLSKAIADGVELAFEQGIQLQGEKKLTAAAAIQVLSSKEVLLTITEGKFHQVKRMFAAVGNRVVSLHRESIGAVQLDVGPQEWRYLTGSEVDSLSREPKL
ncbi:pseudouridine synthase [uncultured Vibrio sp.]|uniref:pseudouridine synthase n=1 Tax=uncultured Vibrio sp. TaxID=114054 RepID=UPI0025F1E3AE|nr:pseudouridine synthase [uncultured Vibrio sp.]